MSPRFDPGAEKGLPRFPFGFKVQDTHRLLQQRSRWRQVTREVHKAARATMRQGVEYGHGG